MQRVKISSIPRALKHSLHSVTHRKNVNMLGHSYSYPTRFSRNTCKQPHAATNYEKFSIEKFFLWKKFLSEKKKNCDKYTIFQK